MRNFLKKVFTIFETDKELKLEVENWTHMEYDTSMYSIMEVQDVGWVIEVSFIQDSEDDSKGTMVTLEPIFENYIQAFVFLKALGPIFYNTIHEVTVFSYEGNLLGRLDLSKSIVEDEESPLKATHDPVYTLQ